MHYQYTLVQISQINIVIAPLSQGSERDSLADMPRAICLEKRSIRRYKLIFQLLVRIKFK